MSGPVVVMTVTVYNIIHFTEEQNLTVVWVIVSVVFVVAVAVIIAVVIFLSVYGKNILSFMHNYNNKELNLFYFRKPQVVRSRKSGKKLCKLVWEDLSEFAGRISL